MTQPNFLLNEDDIQNWKTSSMEECIFTWNKETNNLVIRGLGLDEAEQLKQQIISALKTTKSLKEWLDTHQDYTCALSRNELKNLLEESKA